MLFIVQSYSSTNKSCKTKAIKMTTRKKGVVIPNAIFIYELPISYHFVRTLVSADL